MELSLHDGTGMVELADAAFGRQFNEPLVHQVVTSFLARGHRGTRAQKTRAQVRGGGRKPYRQKGTNRARAGTIRSPLWRGGGRAYAAQPHERSDNVKVNRKMYRGAMCCILSELIRQNRLIAAADFSLDAPKTKTLAARLSALELPDVLIVAAEVDEHLRLSARNLPRVDVKDARGVDPVSLLRHEKVLATVAALKQLEAALT